MYGLLIGFGLMFDKGQKQSSTLSCDSSYSHCGSYSKAFYSFNIGFICILMMWAHSYVEKVNERRAELCTFFME